MKKAYLIISGIMVIVSLLAFFIFIPAFMGRLELNPIIALGSFSFRWYGLILAGAILSSYFVARKNAWKFGISTNDVDDYSFWVAIVGFLGARIYYVLFNYSYFSQHLAEIYRVWHGGAFDFWRFFFWLFFNYFFFQKKSKSFFQLVYFFA